MDRRAFLGGLGAVGLAGFLPGCSPATPEKTSSLFFGESHALGIQLYTLGQEVADDIDGAMAAVAQAGYREVELPGLYGKDPAELKAAADKAGLVIAGLHVSSMAPPGEFSMASSGQEIADVMGALGATKAVMPIHLFPENFDRAAVMDDPLTKIPAAVEADGGEMFRRTAELLNTRGGELKPLGIDLGYHNHNAEFMEVNGKTGWDILMEETDPGLVELEVDLGWVATGGHDPASFVREYSGRVTQVHVKDVAADNTVNYAIHMSPATVGTGTLDWPAILTACAEEGVQHYYLEQEPPFPGTRLEAAQQGAAFLNALEV